MFTSKNISHYALAIALVLAASYVGTQFKYSLGTPEKQEQELIRKYLLNDSPLYGYNRPKLWIHTKYEYNARKWQSFMSRSSTDLNQPYIHLTVKTIINHCGNDFNVCLIDDKSFRQLLPEWKIDITQYPEPMRSYMREQAFAELLYTYGGMIVPNSFVCTRNLLSMYADGVQNDMPFVCENVNRYSNVVQDRRRSAFTSDTTFMGAPKRCPVIRDLLQYLKKRNQDPHPSAATSFFGDTSKWCNERVSQGSIRLMDGQMIGTKTSKQKPILLEDLMEEQALDLSIQHNYGIYIPIDEMLRRNKYQWFSVMPSSELLETNMIITKHLIVALTNTINREAEGDINMDPMPNQIRTVISI